MKSLILLKHNFVEIPSILKNKSQSNDQLTGTIISNLLYFGYTLSKDALIHLRGLNEVQLKSFWSEIEPVLKEITGDNRQMDKFVVYKNFPTECLDMTESQYWINQILMYLGFDESNFTQEQRPRDALFEKLKLKVLQIARPDSLLTIYKGLCNLPNRWTEEQYQWVTYLIDNEDIEFNPKSIPFKENLIKIIAQHFISQNNTIRLGSATDVLRLGVGLSGGDISMREPSKFKKWSKKERRFLLGLLNKTSNLEEDMARDRNKWKKFIQPLHPNDFKKHGRNIFANVCKCYDKLYNDKVRSFNSSIEEAIILEDKNCLELLSDRPGEFLRRLHHLISVFGRNAALKFNDISDKLTIIQLLKIRKYIATINGRENLTVAPKGNWSKLQILDNNKVEISGAIKKSLIDNIDEELSKRLSKKLGNKSIILDPRTQDIKLQTNDSDLSPYGRGTAFYMPDNINFIRTASYWRVGHSRTLWYDNGWNFFDNKWKALGSCCWNVVKFHDGAIFSGDPVSGGEMKGRACQMIDLYLDKLFNRSVRYAVWNILCFSKTSFDEVEEVYAALQWGEKAEKGKLFEPSRCQLNFSVKGKSFTKYIALIDIVERKIIYLDANLKANVRSASSNQQSLSEMMPAYCEYLNTLPSIYDLFDTVKTSKNGIPILYSDENMSIQDNSPAYIFKPSNPNNSFTPINLSELLK